MNKLAAIALVLGFFTSKAQTAPADLPVDPDTKQAKWEGVVDVKDVKKDELYDRGLNWVNTFYTNPAGVIKSQNKETGDLEGKARFKLNTKDKKGVISPNGGIVEYTFNLYFKDGKYKYEITRVHFVAQSYYDVSKWLDKTQANYNEAAFTYNLEQTIEYMEKLEDALDEAMRKSLEKKKSDW
jgi:hypothetical protein